MNASKAAFDAKTALDRMQARSREAHEHEASTLFNAENINAVLSAAAAVGLTAAIFAPSSPMDLSASPTATAIKDMLEKAGFNTEWKMLRQSPDSEPHKVLRVSWGLDAGLKS